MAEPTSIAERFAVPGVGPATPLGRAASAILAAKAAPVFALADAAAGGDDPDAVHDMRVASRRTREALALLEPLYPRKAFDRWSSRLKAVTKALGKVRDADVLIAELSSLAANAKGAEERVTLAWLVGYAQARKPRLVRKMRRRLAELDLSGDRKAFGHFAHGVRSAPEAREPVHGLAAQQIGARVTALYAHLPAALQEDNSLAQHAMRIDAKRLRYCVETFAPCFGPRLEDLYHVLKSLQDELGELHDRDVFTEAVRTAAESHDPGCAGVTPGGVDEVVADLATERAKRFRAFRDIITEWPEARMRSALMEALVSLPPVVEVPGS